MKYKRKGRNAGAGKLKQDALHGYMLLKREDARQQSLPGIYYEKVYSKSKFFYVVWYGFIICERNENSMLLK